MPEVMTFLCTMETPAPRLRKPGDSRIWAHLRATEVRLVLDGTERYIACQCPVCGAVYATDPTFSPLADTRPN